MEAMDKFDIKTEIKLLSAIGKVLEEAGQTNITETEAQTKENFGIMDLANVFMLIPRTEEAKRLLSRFVCNDDHSDMRPIPKLEYSIIGTSRISAEYLDRAIKIFLAMDDNPAIETAKDYPITLTGKHFKVIIAPRVEGD